MQMWKDKITKEDQDGVQIDRVCLTIFLNYIWYVSKKLCTWRNQNMVRNYELWLYMLMVNGHYHLLENLIYSVHYLKVHSK